MKFKIILFLITVLLWMGCDNGSKVTKEKTTKAIEYNTALIDAQKEIMNSFGNLNQAITDNDLELASTYLSDCEARCDNAIKLTKAKGPFMGDESFWLAALKYFEAEKKLFSNEWQEVLQLAISISNGDYDYSETDMIQKRVEKLAEEVDTKGQKYLNDLVAAQKAFAKKYQFALLDEDGKVIESK